MCRHKAHGAGRVRVRVRGRAGAPAQPRVAQHLRDLAASRAGLHGRRGGHEGRSRPYQDTSVCSTGMIFLESALLSRVITICMAMSKYDIFSKSVVIKICKAMGKYDIFRRSIIIMIRLLFKYFL